MPVHSAQLSSAVSPTCRGSLRALEWLNFFIADVQTGIGPFLAAYLVSTGWGPGSVGYALTFGGLITVAFQLPAGAIIDAARAKRPSSAQPSLRSQPARSSLPGEQPSPTSL